MDATKRPRRSLLQKERAAGAGATRSLEDDFNTVGEVEVGGGHACYVRVPEPTDLGATEAALHEIDVLHSAQTQDQVKVVA